MRPLVLIIIAALAAGSCAPAMVASGTGQSSADIMTFGAKVKVYKRADIARLAKTPHHFEGRTIRLEGMVKQVCQGRGCWVEVVDRNGASFMARSLDESILLPKDCAGRWIAVQGVVTRLVDPEHAAHEGHVEELEGGHACPSPEFVVATTGVQLAAK
jgi:hypothetical protein